MKRKLLLFILCFSALAAGADTKLERYFNLCLEFGAPQEVVELFQSFRTYKGENNGSISYVVREDNSLLKDTPYTEYQIWYTIDKEQGLYQSSLIVRGDKPALQNILTGYLRKFNKMHGEPVYTNLDNGSLLIFWYSETTFTVKARLILDIVNSYKYVSITYCSPQMRHTHLLKTLYNGTPDDNETAPEKQASPSHEAEAVISEDPMAESIEDEEENSEEFEDPAEHEDLAEIEESEEPSDSSESVDSATT